MSKLQRVQNNFAGATSEYWLIHFSDDSTIQQFDPSVDFNWTDTFCVDEKKLFKITGTMCPTNYICIYGIVVVEGPALVDSGQSTLLERKRTKIGYEYSLKIAVQSSHFCKVSVASLNGVLI